MVFNFKIIFAVIAIAVGTYAFVPYIRDIFLKRTQPHAYTWLIWTLTQGIAVAGLWYGNGNLGAIGLTIGVFFAFFVFIFSLKYGTRNITKGDTVVLVVALSAILVWWQLNNPILAIFMVSAIDAFGFIPTFRKSWQDPWSETVLSWILFSIGNIFAILALSSYNYLTLTYLITITVFDFIVLSTCLIRRNKVKKGDFFAK